LFHPKENDVDSALSSFSKEEGINAVSFGYRHSHSHDIDGAPGGPQGHEGRCPGPGILPLAKSIWVPWGFEWALPGHGEAYLDCGAWRSKGCLNVDEHDQVLIDGTDVVGKVFVRRYRRTCLRAECPTCYESWAGKEAGKIDYRLSAWIRNGRVIHVIVSPSNQDIATLSYEELRRKCYLVLKKTHVLGGSVIFHPFREDESTKEWYFSPHFHVLGYGWVTRTRENYEISGWVVKNAGIRKTVSGTALYQLSHAGIHEKYHTVTWFGALSYNKLRMPPQEEKREVCPICGQELRALYYIGPLEIPDEDGDFWFEPEGWIYKPGRFSGG